MKKLVILDWDGTLCDSLSRIVQSLRLAAGDLALPLPDWNRGREVIGLGLKEALTALFPDEDDDKMRRLEDRYRQHFVRLDQDPSRFYPGVRETLEGLKTEGYGLAVATGKSRRGLDRALAAHGLEDFFDATRCADETQSKPHPAMLYALMTECGQTAANCLMVGDTTYDMEMASRAGMSRLAVGYGAHSPERLIRHRPVACLTAFSDIKSHL